MLYNLIDHQLMTFRHGDEQRLVMVIWFGLPTRMWKGSWYY